MTTVNATDPLNNPSHSGLHTQSAQKDEANTFTEAQTTTGTYSGVTSTFVADMDTPHGGSGALGPMLTRDATGFPLSVGWTSAGTFIGDMGLDSATTDFVLWYSKTAGGDGAGGDVLRLRQPAHLQLSYAASQPSLVHRFHIIGGTAAQEDATFSTLLYLQSGATGETGKADNYIKGQLNGTENFSLLTSGKMSLGATWQGYTSSGTLELEVAAIIHKTNGDAYLRLARDGTSSFNWEMAIDATGAGVDNSFVIRDADSGLRGFVMEPSAPHNALVIKATGSVRAGTASIATTATDGFIYVPTCAGAPTGVPTSITGMSPIVYDSTNNRIYVYDGAWLNVAVAA